MRTRRIRRSRGTWLPTQSITVSDGPQGQTNSVSGISFVNLAVQNSVVTQLVSPLTFDVPHEGNQLSELTSLATIIGSEYFLDRIVGKLFLNRNFTSSGEPLLDTGPAVLAIAGFFVARADINSDTDFPIGGTGSSQQEFADMYNPLVQNTIREPWIWRRAWILGNSGRAITQGNQTGDPVFSFTPQSNDAYPASTALYNSVLDGPHIDAKTKRRIRNDDRLWFILGLTPFPLNATGATNETFIEGYLDYRLHGSLRKAKNVGTF